MLAEELMRFAQAAALIERRKIQIIGLDAEAGGDLIAHEVEPGELLRREDGSGFGFVHEPFVEALGDGVGEGGEDGLLLEREADEGDEVGEAAGLGAAFDFAGRGDGEGVPEVVLGPGGVIVAQFLFQLLEHRLGEALFVGTAVKDLERGDFSFVLLDVFAKRSGELGAGLRALLRRAGVDQGVARNDVDGLFGGVLDFLEQVAEIGIGGERRERLLDAALANFEQSPSRLGS